MLDVLVFDISKRRVSCSTDEEFSGKVSVKYQTTVPCHQSADGKNDIGEKANMIRLPKAYEHLLEMERRNVGGSRAVIVNTEPYHKPQLESVIPNRQLLDWIHLFEWGQKQQLLEQIEDRCRHLEEKPALKKEEIESLYVHILYVLFTAFHKKGLAVYEAFQSRDLIDPCIPIRTISQLRAWSHKIVAIGVLQRGYRGNGIFEPFVPIEIVQKGDGDVIVGLYSAAKNG
ncbi:hypothetical protein [Paenibacillus sedimenti]|uniref:Uncharacterized protein n=1 Tax=Paenibacillus sedimenti TaxID=2770274 RepID=A0A926KJ55_9BACL|nr:hypothetical protein [Paenibacillus sedimenti]MBD0378555.1 hypothetical protein [Paenibacillus sedimenti]